MNISVSHDPLVHADTDVWMIFVEGEKAWLPPAKSSPLIGRLAGMVKQWRGQTKFKGGAGEVTIFPSWEVLPVRHVLLAGVGERRAETCLADVLFRAGGAASKAIRNVGARSVTFSLPDLLAISRQAPREHLEALLCGFFAGQYAFSQFRDTKDHAKPLNIHLAAAPREAGSIPVWVKEISIIVDTLRKLLDVANLPANVASPETIARQARSLAREYGLQCRVWDEKTLAAKKCGGILAVGQGSVHSPRLILLRHVTGKNSRPPLVFVGKTITFDTGGISLKPGKGMEWMKFDKSGGMAVLAATLAAARLELERPIIGILAVAENMPSGHATRPGDIIRTYSGKTVEILNTDAEGRLVLADALAVAAEFKPAAIVDLATLTGACVVALGHFAAGLMSNDARLEAALRAAGEKTGERVWPLPLWPEYEEMIKGQFAEIKNIGDGSAGPIVGGAFLKQFIPREIPWAHVDIAGTAYAEKNLPYRDAGATLFGARLLLQWARTHQL